jgi:pre-mRNA-splicing factor 38A
MPPKRLRTHLEARSGPGSSGGSGHRLELIEVIVRGRIWESGYWKGHCFGMTTATLVAKAARLAYVGGTYGATRRPAPFLCLAMKLLDLAPAIDVAFEYTRQGAFKFCASLYY